MNKRNGVCLIIVIVLLTINAVVQAQGTPVILSLTVPEFMEDIFANQIIPQFEAEHPGVQVYLCGAGGFGAQFNPASDVKEYLDAVEEYVSSADVLMVDSESLNSEATRAGYFLDLAPLVNSDPTLNGNDFYPAVWQSFQWDGGMWAIPISVDTTLLFYDPEAFDAAGLAYPGGNWTIYDLDYAAQTLTQFNADSSTAMPGFLNFGADQGALFLSVLGQGVYDNGVIPAVPRFDDPELETVLAVWAQMQQDGLMTIPTGEEFDPGSVPLQLSRSSFGGGRRFGDTQAAMSAALLPGGRAGLLVDGYAISSGTRYPQEAYELVKFLSNSPEVVSVFEGVKPAQISLDGAQSNGFQGGGGGLRVFRLALSPEIEEVVMAGIENGIPTGEALFSTYLRDAVNAIVQEGVDVRTALDDLELELTNRLYAADARRGATQIIVALPPETVDLAPGEIRLSFGIAAFVSPLPNQAEWEQVAADFSISDPEVGQVILDASMPLDLTELAETYDCFYMDTNVVQSADLSLLLSLDPLLNSDPAFDPNDMVGNVMQQVRLYDQTWAMPLVIQPTVMRYNPDLFSLAGAYLPTEGAWTVDQFEDALRLLKRYLGDEATPYRPQGFGDSHLLMLIAAYGGLPFDYRTDPATVNFTDPATVEAIRAVLDLVKAGYIDYVELAGTGGGGGFVMVRVGAEEDVALSSETLSNISFGGRGGGVAIGGRGGGVAIMRGRPGADSGGYATFPTGSPYSAVSYDVSAAYISANTQHADACYRFISQVAQSPELFSAMPARRSLINGYDLLAAQGADNVAFYNALDQVMKQPNTIMFPTTQLGGGRSGMSGRIVSYWLDRAFDRYVLQDADLETELAEAETFTRAFQECAAAIPPSDPADPNPRGYFQQFLDCATSIDPTVVSLFGP